MPDDAAVVAPLRLGFVGGGAVGMYLGAHLARAGHRVTIIDGWPENVERIRSAGIRVVPPSSEAPFTQRANVRALHVHETHSLEAGAEFDIGFVAVKAHDTRWAAALVDRFVIPSAEGGYVVSAQNGLPDDDVADVVGRGRAVGLVMSLFSVGTWAPGAVERGGKQPQRALGYTVFRPGEQHARGVTPRVRRLAAVLDVCDKAAATGDLPAERWTKLALNCSTNAPQSVSGLGQAGLQWSAAGRRVIIAAAAEACAVGLARGLAVGAVHGRPAAEWAAAHAGDAAARRALGAHLTPRLAPPPPARWDAPGTKADWKVSMPQDVAKRRRTEVAFLNGRVAAAGAGAGVATPMNDALVALVTRIDRGDAEPSVAHLDALAGAAGAAGADAGAPAPPRPRAAL